MVYISGNQETMTDYRQDEILATSFGILAVISFVRMCYYFDLTGRGRTITAFYFLIFATSLLRSAWFFIPSDYLEGYYTPHPIIAFESNGWIGTFVSFSMLSSGSIALFSNFILIGSYWNRMLQKISAENNTLSPDKLGVPRNRYPYRSPLRVCGVLALILILLSATNATLFLLKVFNSEVMILYDSILMVIVSLVIFIALTILSRRIRTILMMIGAIQSNSTLPQVRRIMAITWCANAFFLCRVAIDFSLAIQLIILAREKRSFSVVLSDNYWSLYIAIKHGSEVAILFLELMISTAIRTYAQLPSQASERRSPSVHEYELVPPRDLTGVLEGRIGSPFISELSDSGASGYVRASDGSRTGNSSSGSGSSSTQRAHIHLSESTPLTLTASVESSWNRAQYDSVTTITL